MKKKLKIIFKYAGDEKKGIAEEPEEILSRVYGRIFDKALGNLLTGRRIGKA